jgi:hypothetical protein
MNLPLNVDHVLDAKQNNPKQAAYEAACHCALFKHNQGKAC